MIVQSDLLIKAAITHILEEARKNPWLLDDIFSQLNCDELLKNIYGQKEIDRAKEWLANNKIDVLLKYRTDSQQPPFVSIALGGSSEAREYSTLSDATTEVETLDPKTINKPIPYVVKPFIIEGYDQATGAIKIPDGINILAVSAGMFAVNPDDGNAYEIEKRDGEFIYLKNAPVISFSKMGVIPKYMEWRARREQAQFQETYSIGCHVHGDPAALIWLHSIVLYGMLRYRETLFEARGLAISSVNSSDMVDRSHGFENPGGEMQFSRWITLTGLVNNTWIKGPHRVIESLVVGDKDSCISGVTIIDSSNDEPQKIGPYGASYEPLSNKKRTIFRR